MCFWLSFAACALKKMILILMALKLTSLGYFRGHSFDPILMKLYQNVKLMKSSPNLKLGHMGPETRSQAQILEKLCVPSRVHSFDAIFMKLCQSVYLYAI